MKKTVLALFLMLSLGAFAQSHTGGGTFSFPTPGSAGLCWVSTGNTRGAWAWAACPASPPSFSAVTGGTNNSAAMVVGTGASLGPAGSGTVTATALAAQYLDWNAVSGPTSIANKPTLAAVATSGSASDLASGVVAKARGGAGADMTSVTFPSAGVLAIRIASGTAAMGTSAIASGACATVVTVAATGTLTTDAIRAGFNGDPTAITGYGASATGAVLTIYSYPTADNVNFKVCNSSSASITPSALTLNWNVVR